MLYLILTHTPTWVWGILASLLAMGLAQTVPRRARLLRVIALPLAMTALSLHGIASGFGSIGTGWLLWAGAALITLVWVASSALPSGVQYHASSRSFSLPGSWLPLLLMMGIFLTKYGVGVMLALQPSMAHDTASAAMIASLYGAMSGIFLGRMVRLLRLAQASEAKPIQPTPVAWG